MDSAIAALEVARRKVGVADHLVTQTFPLVKDPKLLASALQNVSEAVDAGIEALLRHEHEAKRLDTVGDDSAARLANFERHVVPAARIPKEFVTFVSELRETVKEHKESSVEFVRKERLVICDGDYGKVRTLTQGHLRRQVVRAKAFVALLEEKVRGNGDA